MSATPAAAVLPVERWRFAVSCSGATSALHVEQLDQAQRAADALSARHPGRLVWFSEVRGPAFGLSAQCRQQVADNGVDACALDEHQVLGMLAHAQRVANRDIGQYGAAWMREHLATVLAYLSGWGRISCAGVVERHFGGGP